MSMESNPSSNSTTRSTLPTIVAVATPIGRASLGAIRLSGPGSHEIVLSMMETAPAALEFRRLYHSYLRRRDGSLLDETTVCFMKGPASYTGEDMVEIFCHSGAAVLQGIVEEALERGAVIAAPGEFTRRAFIHGKIDLVQAEAVADIVDAETPIALAAALNQRRGAVSEAIKRWRQELIELVADIEAEIDFSEEELLEVFDSGERMRRIETLLDEIEKALATARAGVYVREGISVVLVGKPNVGKSSLMNALLKKDRVIVTAIPGTTRDIVSERAYIQGFPIVLHDSAGIRQASEPVEQIGIDRAREAVRGADVAVLVVDATDELGHEDAEAYALARQAAACVIALNKCDLDLVVREEDVRRGLAPEEGSVPIVRISALTGEGIGELEGHIIKQAFAGSSKSVSADRLFMTNRRHIESLRRAHSLLGEAKGLIDESAAPEVVCVPLREAVYALREIVGEVSNDTILDRIFSRFCIGK